MDIYFDENIEQKLTSGTSMCYNMKSIVPKYSDIKRIEDFKCFTFKNWMDFKPLFATYVNPDNRSVYKIISKYYNDYKYAFKLLNDIYKLQSCM